MTKVIAFAGKGGTGKTTVAALLTRSLVRRGAAPVLPSTPMRRRTFTWPSACPSRRPSATCAKG